MTYYYVVENEPIICLNTANRLPSWPLYIRGGNWERLDDCVGNESLETLFWLKWGFVVMIIGYIYSQKCNKNDKKNVLIYFEFWKHFFVYILKTGYQNSRCNNPVQFGIFLTFLTINIASDQNNKSSFQPE